MAKANNNKKKTKARKRPRAMALRVAEPRVRGPRQPRAERRNSGPHAGTPQPAPLYGMTLTWWPWITMLRQQALMARGVLSVIEVQQQFARLWSLSWRRVPRVSWHVGPVP